MSSDSTAGLLRRRFLLFTGKGGVGKTTVVAALAVHAARLNQRPLVVELGHRASMRSVFRVDDIGFTPKDVGMGVHAMSMDIDMAVLDYMLANLPSRRLARSMTNNKVLERLFKAMPAVGEIATINKLRQLEAETTRDGQRRWSPILVDLDATGHAVMFLELRSTVDNIMGAGPMKRLIESTAAMLANPHISRLSLVATPHELPVTETIELHQRLSRAKTVAFGPVFINQMPRVQFGPDAVGELDRIQSAAEAVGETEVLADVQFGRIVLEQLARAEAQVDRLRSGVSLPIVELPRLPAVRFGSDELARLGELAGQGMAE